MSRAGKQVALPWLVLSVMVMPASPLFAGDSQKAAICIKQGQTAFDANDFDGAAGAFTDALKADPNNAVAQRDLGISNLRLNKLPEATKALELAINGKAPDRTLILAVAAERVANKSPMQAVKVIKNWFDAHPSPPATVDEQMLNAMGIALAQADAAGVRSSLFSDGNHAYVKLNTRLESTKPGEKRWGPDWLPAADVDKKAADAKAAKALIATQNALVAKYSAIIADNQRLIDQLPKVDGENNITEKINKYQRNIDNATAQQAQAQAQIDQAQKSLDEIKPNWPDEIPTDTLDLSTAK